VIDRPGSSLIGASILSAAGSLPLHLAPLIIAVLVIDGRTAVYDAGWITTATLLGQFGVALFLPLFGVGVIARTNAIALAVMLLAGLLLSGSDGMSALLLGWFVVGGCCGGLQYLGTLAAAAHPNPRFAYSVRLGVVLSLAGFVAGALQWTAGLSAYRTMTAVLMIVFSTLLVIGLLLYRPVESRDGRHGGKTEFRLATYFGLAILFVLFVGQSGLLAYAVQNATERGIGLKNASWALAAMKVAAGWTLLFLARRVRRNDRNPSFAVLGTMLAVSDLVVATTTNSLMFFLGLLGLETGFNLISARLQAEVARGTSFFGSQWLLATMLFGAASGPSLRGATVGLDVGDAFVLFAMLSAVSPIISAGMRSRLDEIGPRKKAPED